MEVRSGSGRPVRLRFVSEENRIYVIPTSSEAGWFATALRTGEAQVRWEDGREERCAAQVVYSPEEIEHIHALFRAKFGVVQYQRYFETARRALQLDPHRVPIAPSPEERLQTEFDSVAPGYDALVASRPIEQYLKDRASDLLVRSLQGFDPLLEIGPGTGYHTLPLLRLGHRVLAVDLSEAMLNRLRERAAESKVSDRLRTRTGRLRDLERLVDDVPGGSFQAAYSAFGAFNLEPDLGPAIRAIARLLGLGGRLVFTSLSRPALAPMAWEMLAGHPRAALHHISEVVPVGGSRYPLEVQVPGLATWDRMLQPAFRRTRLEAVSAIAPPFDSPRLVAFLGKGGARRARRIDVRLVRFSGSWIAAEWVLLTYERTRAPARDDRAA